MELVRGDIKTTPASTHLGLPWPWRVTVLVEDALETPPATRDALAFTSEWAEGPDAEKVVVTPAATLPPLPPHPPPPAPAPLAPRASAASEQSAWGDATAAAEEALVLWDAPARHAPETPCPTGADALPVTGEAALKPPHGCGALKAPPLP